MKLRNPFPNEIQELKFYGNCEAQFTKKDMMEFAKYYMTVCFLNKAKGKTMGEIFDEWIKKQ